MFSKTKRLQIITSPYCNNNCVFCIDNRLRGKLSLAVLTRDAAGTLKKMRGQMDRVLFTAGEPTLNKKLLELIVLAKKLSYKEIGLISNGRLLADKKFCQKLLSAGLNEISVSIHGDNEKIHEKMTRTRNSFKETSMGIKNLDFFKKKYHFNFFVNFTVTRLNFKNVSTFIRFISRFKVNGIIFNMVIPKGRALANFNEVMPFYSVVSREFKKIFKVLGAKNFSISVLGLPFCLMSGFENFAGNFEKIVTKNPGLKKNLAIKSVFPWGRKIKSLKCKKCAYTEICDGIWFSYIKRRGWKEFKPVNYYG